MARELGVSDDIDTVDALDGGEIVEDVVDHRLARNGQQRFRLGKCKRIKPGGVSGGEDDYFHILPSKRLGAISRAKAWQRQRISEADSQPRANSASCFASFNFSRRMRNFTGGTSGGAALNSSTPKPSSSAVRTGSPAISPQTPTQRPAFLAASTVALIRRRMAGCVGSYKWATFSFMRSTARVYWMRSLVPRLKNFKRRARLSATRTAEGISIIAPISRF